MEKSTIEGLSGHANINLATQNVKYDYPNNLPILFDGVLTREQMEKAIEEKRSEVRFVAMAGAETRMVFSNVEQVKVARKRLEEIAEDLEKIAIYLES